MTTTISLAETIMERLQTEASISIGASWEEYWELLAEMEDQPYVLEYHDHEIHATMSQASDNHETIIANIASILRAIFYNLPEFRLMGSSKVVYIEECDKAVNPDALVVKGASNLMPRKGKATALTNPYLVVEVHADSTEDDDMKKKLPCYKKCGSVQQIVYIDQHSPAVSVYTKQGDAYHWLNEDADALHKTIQIAETDVLLAEIYHKVAFAKA
jgi:Uma2 family endonuclease